MKLDQKQQVIKFRHQGLSYTEIQVKTGVSKDSISRWVKAIKLTNLQQLRIAEKQRAGRIAGSKKAVISNNKKYNNIKDNINSVALKKLKDVTERDRFLAGIGLYAGDGTKANKTLEFTNGDPNQILFMYNWFRKSLSIPKQKIGFSLWIHENNDLKKAESFWKSLLKIKSINRVYFVKNSNKPNKKYPLGIAKIYVYSTQKLYTVLAWIDAIIIPQQSPVAQR